MSIRKSKKKSNKKSLQNMLRPIKSKKLKSKTQSIVKLKSIKKSISLNKNFDVKYQNIKNRFTRKDVRKYEVERVSNIISLLPKFTNFYNKLSSQELMALKFYKGAGSFWQTQLLTNEKTPREVLFPFDIWEEQSFRNDIYSEGKDIYPMLKSFDIKDIPNYIENNYKARIKLLNTLDTIYNKKDCPHFTGEEILFRGMSAPPSLKKCKEGDNFLFKNFMSTTFDRNISEIFSGNNTLLIFTNMKDIPFLYMPNNKTNASSGINYTKNMKDLHILDDYSECTLPRNLEFTIDKIEEGILSPMQSRMFDGGPMVRNTKTKTIRKYNKLEKLLKQKGLIESSDDKNDDKNDKKNDDKNKLIEDKIFPKIKVYYCSFLKWHPRNLLVYDDIMKDAKYILDKYALRSWNNKNDDNF